MKYRPVENNDEPDYVNCKRCGFDLLLSETKICPVCGNDKITTYRKPIGVTTN